MTGRAAVVLATLLALAALVAACGTGPPDHVRIGLVAPLTGERAFIGQEMLRGARMAVEDQNADGGLLGRPVELVTADDADLVDLPGQLADLAERGRVSAVVGPEAPGVLLSPRSPLERRDVPAVLPTAFGGDLARAPTFVGRTVPSARQQAHRLGRWLVDTRDIDTVAVLIADPVEGAAVRGDLLDGLAAGGARTTATVTADAAVGTLAPSVSRLRRAADGAGAVLLWAPPPAAARATLAIRDQGWDVQVMVPSSAFVAEYRTLAGEATEGAVLAFPFRREWFGPELTRWMVRYHGKHGMGALPQLETLVLDLPVIAAATYDAVGIVAAAVDRADSREPGAVADALPVVESEGLLRTYRLADSEAWTTADLHVARFHRLGVVYDVDPRLDRGDQRRFWEQQVGAEFIPESVLEGPGGDVIREIIESRAGTMPTYEPPLPPPGPVGRP